MNYHDERKLRCGDCKKYHRVRWEHSNSVEICDFFGNLSGLRLKHGDYRGSSPVPESCTEYDPKDKE